MFFFAKTIVEHIKNASMAQAVKDFGGGKHQDFVLPLQFPPHASSLIVTLLTVGGSLRSSLLSCTVAVQCVSLNVLWVRESEHAKKGGMTAEGAV